MLVVCPKCKRNGDGTCDECGGHGATVVHRDLKPENAATEAVERLRWLSGKGERDEKTGCLLVDDDTVAALLAALSSPAPAPSAPAMRRCEQPEAAVRGAAAGEKGGE